jgi:hypothetical protein
VKGEEKRLTPCNLVHLVNSRLWYRLIIQSLKEDIQSPFRIIHDPLDRSLGISPSSVSGEGKIEEGRNEEGRDIQDEKPV